MYFCRNLITSKKRAPLFSHTSALYSAAALYCDEEPCGGGRGCLLLCTPLALAEPTEHADGMTEGESLVASTGAKSQRDNRGIAGIVWRALLRRRLDSDSLCYLTENVCGGHGFLVFLFFFLSFVWINISFISLFVHFCSSNCTVVALPLFRLYSICYCCVRIRDVPVKSLC